MSKLRIYDADWLLREWVLWTGGGDSGEPERMGNTLSPLIKKKSTRTTVLSDDEAMIIQNVMMDLKNKTPDIAKAVVLFYSKGELYTVVGENMKIHEKIAHEMVHEGVAWVDGRLENVPGLSRVKNLFSEVFGRCLPVGVIGMISTEELHDRLISALS